MLPTRSATTLFFLILLASSQFAEAKNGEIDWRSLRSEQDHNRFMRQIDSVAQSQELSGTDFFRYHHLRGKRCVVLSRYDEAIDHFQEGLQKSREQQVDSFQAIFLNQIGVVKYYLGQKNEAIDWFKKSQVIATKTGLFNLQASCLNNIGALYTETKKYDSAVAYLKEAIELWKTNEGATTGNYLHTYRILATTYENMGETEKGAAMYREIYRISRETKDSLSMQKALIYLSTYHANTGNKDSALYLGELMLDILRTDTANKNSLVFGLTTMANIHRVLGDYQPAFEALEEAYQLNSQVFTSDLEMKIGEMEAAFNTETERQQRKLAEAEASVANQRLRTLGIGSLLVILGLGFGFFAYRQRQQRLSAEQMAQVQKGRLAAVLEGESRERTRIARELHDGVSQLISAVKMNLNAAGVDDQQSLSLLDRSMDEVRSMSHNLLPKQLGKGNLSDALQQMAKQLDQPGKLSVQFSSTADKMNLEADVRSNIYRIAQEVVNNAIKHAQATVISIELKVNDAEIELYISDDGSGMKAEAMSESKGIGWKNIQARVELLNGQIKLIPSSKGTNIKFWFPIN